MDDLRLRFAALDRITVPDLQPEVDRRRARLAEGRRFGVRTRLDWGSGLTLRDRSLDGRRFRPMPVLLVVALLVGVLVATVVIGASWWWHWPSVMVPPSTQRPTALTLAGDCPGAVDVSGDAPPFRGWILGPEPGFFATPQPGRITALWHELSPRGQPPGGASPPVTQLVLVEVDPVTRTMCRLLTPVRQEQAGLLESASLPDLAWAPRGDALAYFHGDVEFEDGCCAPGILTVWWPGGHADVAAFNEENAHVDWSNRGELLAVTSGLPVRDWAEPQPQRIALHAADGSAPRELRFDCDPCVISGSSFSPDDTHVAVTYWRIHEDQNGADALIGLAEVDTGAGVVLDVGPTALRILGWRDDRTILAVDDGRRLLAIPVDAPSQFAVLATFPLQLGSEEASWESWSPDLSKIAYIRQEVGGDGQVVETDILVLDVATGMTHHVGRELELHGPEFVWAPDNRTFTYGAWIDAAMPERGVYTKVADAFEGEPVAIALGLSPVAWRPVWQ